MGQFSQLKKKGGTKKIRHPGNPELLNI